MEWPAHLPLEGGGGVSYYSSPLTLALVTLGIGMKFNMLNVIKMK